MSYTQVIIDLTSKFGCPECAQYRHTVYHMSEGHMKHWQTCKIHRRCIELQHLAHQPELNDNQEFLPESADERAKQLADIETEDGSLERELNKRAEWRFQPKEECPNPEYIPEPPSREFHPIPASKEALSLLLPMCAIARGSCRSTKGEAAPRS